MEKSKTRLISLTTAMLMVLTLFACLPYGVIRANAQGTGTEKDPIIVKTYDELRTALDRSKATKAGKLFVKLGNDIIQEDYQNRYNMVLASPVEQEVTLDLNGHKLSRTTESVDNSLFQIGENGGNSNYTLNVKDSAGGGEIYYGDNNISAYKYMFWINNGKLNIYGGTFTTDYNKHICIYTWGGATNIYGGTFSSPRFALKHDAGNVYIHNGIFNVTEGDNENSYCSLEFSSNAGYFCIYNCTLNCTNKNEDYFCSMYISGIETASKRSFLAHLPSNAEIRCDGVKQNDLEKVLFKGRKIVVTDKTDYNVDIKVTEPKQGAKPSFKCTINNANVYLSLYMDSEQVFWYQLYEENVHPMDEKETFDLEKYDYKCYTKIRCDNLYFFQKAKITVNGKPCSVTGNASNEKEVSFIFTKKKTQKGDLTGDGKITIADVIKVAAHIKGKNILTKEQQAIVDINGDGEVTIIDLTKMAAHAKGKRLIK